jgi:hypothetical protein
MIPSFVKVQQDGDAESLSGLLSCFVKNRMGRDFLCIRRGAAKLPLCHYGFFSYKKKPDGEGLSPALLGLDSMASQRSNAANRGMVVELKFSSLRMQFVAL